MNIDLNKILEWLGSLSEMQAVPLTFIFCLALGRALKWIPFVKNNYIPCIVVFFGPLMLLGLTDFKESPAMTVRSFYFRTAIIGFITSTTAWLSHRFILRPLMCKILGKDADDNSDPPFPKRDGSNVNPLAAPVPDK